MVKRIFLPFLGAMLILTCFTFWRTTWEVNSLIEKEYWGRMERIISLLAKRPYLLNSSVRMQLEEVLGAGIGLYDLQGRPLRFNMSIPSGSASNGPWPDLSRDDLSALVDGKAPFVYVKFSDTGESMSILLHSLSLTPDETVIIALKVPAGHLSDLRRGMLFALATNTGIGLCLLLVLVLAFSRPFRQQLEQLLNHMETVAKGRFKERVPVKGLPEWKRLAVAFNDMIEQIEAFQERLRTSERLAAVGELSAVLAHEVRNPLTALKMMGQVLQRRLGSEKSGAELVTPMLREIDRIDVLVRDILDWSTPRNPELALHDLNHLTSEVLDLAGPAIQKQGLRLDWHPGKVPPVSFDPGQIKQVIWNLLNNARRVSTPGQELKVHISLMEEKWVCLTIEDQGPGLPAGSEDKIFEPFYTTHTKGLGLGLSISQRIIHGHGGKLRLENRPDGGVRATLCLPVVSGHEKVAAVAAGKNDQEQSYGQDTHH